MHLIDDVNPQSEKQVKARARGDRCVASQQMHLLGSASRDSACRFAFISHSIDTGLQESELKSTIQLILLIIFSIPLDSCLDLMREKGRATKNSRGAPKSNKCTVAV